MESDELAVTNLQEAKGGRRKSVLRWFLGVSGFVIVVVGVAGMFIRLPYVAFSPGQAVETESRLSVSCDTDATCIDTFDSDGEVLFTTVKVRQRPNLWEYLWFKNNSDVNLIAEERILGDRTPKENQQVNAELMTDSKEVAVAVALEQLGYDAVEVEGLYVANVIEGQPAEGILQANDQLVAIDGKPVSGAETLLDVLAGYAPDEKIVVSLKRITDDTAPSVEEVTITLGENPEDSSRAFMGIQPVNQYEFNEFEFDVEINTREVGGPSAGLAFTLSILDKLTEGELTGGDEVAVTGSISPDGQVGQVGGVVQKTLAVKKRGIKVFIVPARLPEQEMVEVKEAAGDDVEIVPVVDIDEALEALDVFGGDVEAVKEFAANNV